MDIKNNDQGSVFKDETLQLKPFMKKKKLRRLKKKRDMKPMVYMDFNDK